MRKESQHQHSEPATKLILFSAYKINFMFHSLWALNSESVDYGFLMVHCEY